jgi:hypothetical protein
MCLATLAPFTVACLVLAVLDPIVATRSGRSADPGAARLLGSALCVLGAGMLAVAVARWLRFTGAALAIMVAVVATSVRLDYPGHTLLQPLTDWALWSKGAGNSADPFVGVAPGSPGWHNVYLIGLVLLAASAALLSHRPARYPALAFAAVGATLTVVGGAAQFP